MRSVRIVGNGRAGGAFAAALRATGRWDVAGVLARGDDVTTAAAGVDLLLLTVPDPAVADVAAAIEPSSSTVVAHAAGSLGLAPLAPHPRRAVLHPLASLPDGDLGAARLRNAWWGLAADGDPLAEEVVADLDGHPLHIAEADRDRYHAAAAMAANHVVALLGQVDRVAASIGVPLVAYLDLARTALDNVAALGPTAALTGPVRRGDVATVRRHLQALPEDERPGYAAMMEEARRLCST